MFAALHPLAVGQFDFHGPPVGPAEMTQALDAPGFHLGRLEAEDAALQPGVKQLAEGHAFLERSPHAREQRALGLVADEETVVVVVDDHAGRDAVDGILQEHMGLRGLALCGQSPGLVPPHPDPGQRQHHGHAGKRDHDDDGIAAPVRQGLAFAHAHDHVERVVVHAAEAIEA